MAASTTYMVSCAKVTDVMVKHHPLTGSPSFFVHPCNTAESMRELLGERDVSAVDYLLIWLGLVGSCVGLHVPKELVVSIT